MQHILVVRTDRIGDVLLTLPVATVIRSSHPDAEISFLVRTYTSELIRGHEAVDTVLLYDGPDGEKPFFAMLLELRSKRFDAVVVAYPRFRIALLLFLARIPTRAGTGYRWYSFLFNRRVYEHRKLARKHESEYNLSLAQALGCDPADHPRPVIRLTNEERVWAEQFRNSLRLTDDRPLVVLHPGSRGSARDWNPSRFGELAKRLIERNIQVVVSSGPGEQEMARALAQASGARSFPGILNLRELAAFIETADVFSANSTGPLHIAAAVGTPVVGLYPPVPVMGPVRWGPLVEPREILVPSTERCPVCKGGVCRSDICMDQITVDEVMERIQSLLDRRNE